MNFGFGMLLKIALSIGGCLSVLKGFNDGFISSKAIEQASWVRLLLGFVFMLLGIFLIYFADLFPPVSDFLRPFVTAIVGFPKAMTSLVEQTATKNL